MNTDVAIVVVLAMVVVVACAVLVMQRRKSQQIRDRYGAEYLAAVDELGDRRKAEAELRRRERRVQRFDIRPLAPNEADRFAARWRRVQADFVDDPGAAIDAADALLGEVMHARGYPVADFEQRAADLSVDHAKLVADYRIAHEVAMRHSHGEAGTEDLRRAMIHYRDLFDELVAPSAQPSGREEPRSFREVTGDDPAARDRDARRPRDPDDRATRERRRGDRPGGGRTPLV